MLARASETGGKPSLVFTSAKMWLSIQTLLRGKGTRRERYNTPQMLSFTLVIFTVRAHGFLL